MRQKARAAGLSVALVCAGILSACGDPPLGPQRITPTPASPGPVAPAPPPVPPDIYKGSYTLTMELPDTCSALPAAARTRTYSATIDDYRPTSPLLTTDYLVTLSGATFASWCGTNVFAPGPGCHQFFATNNGAGLTFGMVDLDWGAGGQIVERLPDGSQLAVVGWKLSGRLEDSILEARGGEADAFYCAVADEMTGHCHSGSAYCRTEGLRLRFTRQP